MSRLTQKQSYVLALASAIFISYLSVLYPSYLKIFFKDDLEVIGDLRAYRSSCPHSLSESYCTDAFDVFIKPQSVGRWLGIGRVISAVRARCAEDETYFYFQDNISAPGEQYETLQKYQFFQIPAGCKQIHVEAWSRIGASRKGYLGGQVAIGSQAAIGAVASFSDIIENRIPLLFVAILLLGLLFPKREKFFEGDIQSFEDQKYSLILFMLTVCGVLQGLIPIHYPTFFNRISSFFSINAHVLPVLQIGHFEASTKRGKGQIRLLLLGINFLGCCSPYYAQFFMFVFIIASINSLVVSIVTKKIFWLLYAIVVATTLGHISGFIELPGSMTPAYFICICISIEVLRRLKAFSNDSRTHREQKKVFHDLLGPIQNLKTKLYSRLDVNDFRSEISHLESTIYDVLPEKVFRSLEKVNLSDSLQLALKVAGISNFKLADGIKDSFIIEKSYLTRAVINLVSNSLEAMSSNEPVSISYSANEDLINIRILDRGTGMPKNLNLTSKTNGSGLGLESTLDCISALGGTLTFQENCPQGTIASISIPIIHPVLFSDPRRKFIFYQEDGAILQFDLKSQEWIKSNNPELSILEKGLWIFEQKSSKQIFHHAFSSTQHFKILELKNVALIEDDKYVRAEWIKSARNHGIQLDIFTSVQRMPKNYDAIFIDRFVSNEDSSFLAVRLIKNGAKVYNISMSQTYNPKTSPWESVSLYCPMIMKKSAL